MDNRQAPVGLVEVDGDGRIVSMNAAASEMIGGLDHLFEAVGPDDRDRLAGHLDHVAATDEGQRTHIELLAGDVPMLLTSTRHGSGAMIALTDITSLHRRIQNLEQQAFTDPLTGVANRALFMQLVSQALTAALRTKACTALLFIDIDNFKAVNDTYGHSNGDAVLVEMARRLQTALRPVDVVARIGGDEFVVLAGGLDDEEAVAVAHRILALCSAPLSVGGTSLVVSVSIGVSVEDPGADPQQGVDRADTAMYAAKAAGRAEVVAWTPQLHAAERKVGARDVETLAAANRDLRNRFEQLRDEARRDARTGLLRDTAFEEHVGALRSAGVPFSVTFVDIDLFSGYNERYTHIVGHRILAQVATALQDAAVHGSVFRYGGEEFTIVMPRTEMSMDDAEELAHALPGIIAGLDLEYDTSPFGRVTVSVGVAHTEDGADDVTAAADAAMLRAKAGGRNRARVHRQSQE